MKQNRTNQVFEK